MQQTCATCQAPFEISDDDLALLSKLSPSIAGTKVELPPPRDCPECRQQGRMSFRNERKLYKRTCDITGKEIISIFEPNAPYKVCDKDHWYSDKFDAKEYGRAYDDTASFFEQFHQLALDVPMPSLRVELAENCDYNNDLRDCQNCYLCARTHESQNLMYTYRGNRSSDSTDCTQITKSELLYECVDCYSCYSSRYLFFCNECTDCSFLLDCRNCMSCFMCTNLRNKQYCFLNEQLTKEEYEKKTAELDFGFYDHVQKAYAMYDDIKKKAIRRDLLIVNGEGCTGDNIVNCKDCVSCFSVQDAESSRYLWDVKRYKDSMDCYSGGRNSELMYASTAGASSYSVQCCLRTSECNDVAYSFYLNNCKDCFGCIGLKRDRYCILNKEYSEEEYNDLLPKIIKNMQARGEWGHFFPPQCSLFSYNETVAHEFFPLEKERALQLGYRWKEDDQKDFQPQTYEVPGHIRDVQDDILDAILACETCKKNYKIMPAELKFYRNHNYSIPRHCVDCRHLRRFQTRNPYRVHEDTCRLCGKVIKTTYPESTEMQIYCEECYLKEVY